MFARAVGWVLWMMVACQPAAPQIEAEPETRKEEMPMAPARPGPPMDPLASAPAVAKECEATLADVPTALFDDSVLVRLPVGVELTEVSPKLAHTTAKATASACGAVVRYAAVGLLATPPGRAAAEIRDSVLAEVREAGAGTLTWSEEMPPGGRYYHGAYTGTIGGAPVKGWFALKERPGSAAWALFEAHPDAFPTLQPTFMQAGKRVLVVPSGK
jgi:hypothetical protein